MGRVYFKPGTVEANRGGRHRAGRRAQLDCFVAVVVEALRLQRDTCRRLGVAALPPEPGTKLGIALTTIQTGLSPLHGIRHPPAHGTNGWYIWAGEGTFSEEHDFFDPLHVEHLIESGSPVVVYLALPPGWRFLIAPGREAVWEDASLRKV